MATNVVYNQGDNLSLPVPADTNAGDFVLVGDQGLFGVAMTDRGGGGNPATHASVQRSGVFTLPVSTATAANIGDKVFAKSDGTLTPEPDNGAGTDYLHVGWFVAPKGTTDGEPCQVLLAADGVDTPWPLPDNGDGEGGGES